MLQYNPSVSGSLIVTGSAEITGSLLLNNVGVITSNQTSSMSVSSASYASTASYVVTANTASFVTTAQTASYVTTAQTASYVTTAETASYVATASFVTTAQTASYVTTAQTASYVTTAQTASYVATASFVTTAQTASYITTAETASYVTLAQTASYVTTAQTASYVATASFVTLAQTASFVTTAQTASYVVTANTASFVTTAQTASYVLNAISASYAATSSYATNLTVSGTLIAQTLVVQTITSSIEYSSGSNRFGSLSTDTQTFTGSVGMTGSLTVVGPVNASSFTGSIQGTATTASFVTLAQTASFVTTAQTASYVLNAVSASYASTASYVVTANTASFVTTAQTASFVTLAQTASFVTTAQTASFVTTAQTASYVATASFVTLAQTASFVTTAQTASFVTTAQTASYVATASFVTTAQTASFVTNAQTASFVTTAQTASYVLQAVSASYASNGGVTSIVAGTNVTISPTDGLGAVTINASGGGGSSFPYTGSAIISGSLNVTGSGSFNGNVGIGIDAPVSRLHMVGDFTQQTSLNAAAQFFIIARKSRGTVDSPLTVNVNDEAGGILFSGYDGTSWRSGAGIRAVVQSVSTGVLSSNLEFFAGAGSINTATRVLVMRGDTQNVLIGTTADSGYKLNVNGTGRFSGSLNVTGSGLFTGNIGIGTSSPSTTIDLFGSTATTFGLSLEPSGWNTAKHRFTVPTSGDTSMWSFNYNGSTVDTSLYSTSAITLSQGLIAFYTTGSGNVPAERMRINGSGNVGIGTTSPSYKLDVSGSFRISGSQGNFIVADTGNDIYLTRNGASYFIANQASSVISYLMGTGVSQSLFLANNGNVGIGTTSPTQNLHVSASSTATIRIQGASATGFDLQNDNTGGYVWNRDNTVLYFGTNNTERMRITNDGNVGIGTTSPIEKLNIADGNICITNSSASSSQVREFFNYINPSGSVASSNGVIFGFRKNTSFLNRGASVRLFQSGTSDSSGDADTNISFWTYGLGVDNGAERMRITSAGNVGIGSTSPNSKLDVNGNLTVTGSGIFSQTGATPLTIQRTTANSNVGIRYQNNTTSWYAGLAGDDAFGISFNDPNLASGQLKIASTGAATFTGDVNIYKSGSDRVLYMSKSDGTTTIQLNTNGVSYITAGNVGIGTSSPNAMLDVYTIQGGSTIASTHGTSGSYPKVSGISFGATSTSLTVSNNGGTTTFTGGAGIYANNTAASNNPTDLIFWTTSAGSPTERMRIISDGNVGIGTTSPNSKLEVNGSVNVTGSLTVSGANNFIIFPELVASENFADDTAAAAGGVPVGGLYRNGNFVLIRLV